MTVTAQIPLPPQAILPFMYEIRLLMEDSQMQLQTDVFFSYLGYTPNQVLDGSTETKETSQAL
jgi:hypothetical protein